MHIQSKAYLTIYKRRNAFHSPSSCTKSHSKLYKFLLHYLLHYIYISQHTFCLPMQDQSILLAILTYCRAGHETCSSGPSSSCVILIVILIGKMYTN